MDFERACLAWAMRWQAGFKALPVLLVEIFGCQVSPAGGGAGGGR